MNTTKRINLLIGLILGALVLTACGIGNARTVRGSGNVIEESRAVSGVSSVELATLGNLIIELGDTESFRIEAEDNLMEHLETDVLAGKFRIKTKDRIRLNPTEPVNYYLTVTNLEAIKITSSGDIQAPDLEADKFSINISSSGDLEMGDLEAETLTVKISSAGNVTMGELHASALEVNINSTGNLDIAGGRVKTQNITIGSSGNYTAQDMESEEADVRLSSAGSAYIWVEEELKAKLNSSGDLHYRGNPFVDADTNSSGDVIMIRE